MRLDNDFLAEMGLSAMPENEKQAFLDYVEEELQVRIGQRISDGMTDSQLEEFSKIEDKEKAVQWLELHRPDYEHVVMAVIEELKSEISANRDQILN